VSKVKSSVLLYRPADRESELILKQTIEPGRRQHAARIKRIVAEEIVQRAVNVVASASSDYVHDSSGRAPEFGRVVGVDDSELLHCFLRRRGALNSRSG